MSGTATIAITVGVAVAVLVGFFIVYYLGNVANSIYDVKVGVRKDFDKKIKELQDWVDKDTKQRINWMRDENSEQGKRFKESVEGHLEDTFGEMQKTVERLQADVASLQLQVQNLQNGKGMAPAGGASRMPPRTPKAGPGDLELGRVGMPDSEMAPDMAVPPPSMTPSDDEDVSGTSAPKGPTPPEKSRAKTKPSPPPPPASASQPAGQASVRAKADKKQKKKRNPDEFESFGAFSNDFKAGGG